MDMIPGTGQTAQPFIVKPAKARARQTLSPQEPWKIPCLRNFRHMAGAAWMGCQPIAVHWFQGESQHNIHSEREREIALLTARQAAIHCHGGIYENPYLDGHLSSETSRTCHLVAVSLAKVPVWQKRVGVSRPVWPDLSAGMDFTTVKSMFHGTLARISFCTGFILPRFCILLAFWAACSHAPIRNSMHIPPQNATANSPSSLCYLCSGLRIVCLFCVNGWP